MIWIVEIEKYCRGIWKVEKIIEKKNRMEWNGLNDITLVCFPHLSHSIFFNFSNILNYSIPFHFFSTIFFNFPNPYTISLNLNHSYHLEISKVKSFLHHFYKLLSNHYKSFSNYFFHPKKWDGMAKIINLERCVQIKLAN